MEYPILNPLLTPQPNVQPVASIIPQLVADHVQHVAAELAKRKAQALTRQY